MDVVFGLWADGGGSPDHGGDAGGSLGQPVVGPLGLVEILETTLGLGGPRRPQVVRIAAFQNALEAMDGGQYWSASMAMDPWATARTLLVWRDELIGLGWRPEAMWKAPRLSQLAIASTRAGDMTAGLSDRIVAVLDGLMGLRVPPVQRVRLVDPIDLLPSPLRRLVGRLAEIGCEIREIEPRPAAPPHTSLGKLQRWVLGATDPIDGADGTVTFATCSSRPLAAEILAQWTAARSAAPATFVVQDGDTALLDHGLAGMAQPRAGRSAASVHRGSLQLLLLAFRSAWSPFDPKALLEILVFPASPLPPRAAWHLANAIEEAPGRGGPEWQEAWICIAAGERERAREDADELARIQPRLDRWREWAEPVMSDPDAGMKLPVALAICDRVTTWAAGRYAATDDLLYAATTQLAAEVRAALAALGKTLIPRLLVERIIDQALDVGQPNPESRAEAAAWRSVSHPGAVWASTPSVVWWNFTTTQEGASRSPWTQAERAELARAGCPADDATLAGRSASVAWERAVINARDSVLFVGAGLGCDDEDGLHPLAHRIRPAMDRVGRRVTLEEGLSLPRISIGNVTVARVAVTAKPLPTPKVAWPTPEGFTARVEGITLSATSLESLLACQLMWSWRNVAHLRPGRVRSIPDVNRLLGNLAHAIARAVFLPGAPPDPIQAARRAAELLEGLIDQSAAPLRHPEFAEELNQARRRMPPAMGALAQCLADNSLLVEATEMPVEGVIAPLPPLRGFVDLMARDPEGGAVILDLKWSRSDKTRVVELEDGLAVQLATYGALASPGQPYRAGYFLLNQRQFLTLAGDGLVGRKVEGARSLPDTWTAILAAWRIWTDTAAAGRILAAGVPGVADHLPPDLEIVRQVRCDRCDYATLCRTTTV